MKSLLVSIAVSGTIVSAQAAAQVQREGPLGLENRDITRQQAERMAELLFYSFNMDGDGQVSRLEAEQASARDGVWVARTMSFGSSRSLTLQQFQSQALARFERDDLDHDGTLSFVERQQARKRLQEQSLPGQ